jgi:hypothetical protein
VADPTACSQRLRTEKAALFLKVKTCDKHVTFSECGSVVQFVGWDKWQYHESNAMHIRGRAPSILAVCYITGGPGVA